jgi:hypothetical protein
MVIFHGKPLNNQMVTTIPTMFNPPKQEIPAI